MNLYKSTKKALVLALATLATTSCNVLDRDPLDQVGPKAYYNTADQLSTFPINYYASIFQGAW